MAFKAPQFEIPCRTGDGVPINISNAALYGRSWAIDWTEIEFGNGVNMDVILVNAGLFGRHWLPEPFVHGDVQFPQFWGDFELGPGYTNLQYREQWYLENVTHPCVFTLIAGTLPPGLALINVGATAEGEISGIPTTVGSWTFTLRATNIDTFADKIFTIEIRSPTLSTGIVVPVSSAIVGGGTAYVSGN